MTCLDWGLFNNPEKRYTGKAAYSYQGCLCFEVQHFRKIFYASCVVMDLIFLAFYSSDFQFEIFSWPMVNEPVWESRDLVGIMLHNSFGNCPNFSESNRGKYLHYCVEGSHFTCSRWFLKGDSWVEWNLSNHNNPSWSWN